MKRINLLIIAIGLIMPMTAWGQSVTIAVDANQNKRMISPYIYGKNEAFDQGVPLQLFKDAGLRFARMNGGNNASAYNWRNNLAVHPDWMNNVYANNWDTRAQTLKDNFPGVQGMFAFQLLGRAASTGSNNFPDWTYMQAHPGWNGFGQNLAGGGTPDPAGGNKALVDGNIDLFSKPWPADSSVAIINHWFGTGGLGFDKNQFVYWSMDNEADIWVGTHDWAMLTQLSSSAFVDRYIELAKKAKALYPNIKLCGPVTTAEWQWYKWSSESIWLNGRYYPWIEYFIKRLGDEYKATGVKLVDVVDIHNYPWYNNNTEALQGHRIYYDDFYDYPGSNGLFSSTGGWDTTLKQQYIFKRINGWLNEQFGANHGITTGVSEWGTMTTNSNPNIESVIYASHLGTFANNGVELFSPWHWTVGMWETMHLFSKNAKKYSVLSTSSLENTVSAYSSVNENADSLTVMLVNRDMAASRTVTINLSNFNVDNGNYNTLQLSSLPATETFVSESQNALNTSTVAVNSNSLTITVPALSTTAILLKKTGTIPDVISNDITVFNFDGVTPSFSSWSDTFVGEANPLSGGVNTSANAGKYTHNTMWSEVSTPVSIDSREYTSYEVSYYTPTSTTGSVSIACYDASDKQLDWYAQPITTAGVWTKYTRNLNCTGIIAKVAVSFNIDKNPSITPSENIVYIDNLNFKKSTTLTLYAEKFSASWSPYASWSGAPSTNTGSWFGGVNLQTTGDANINLDQWWGDSGHVLKVGTTDAEIIFPNINVAGFDSLRLSADMAFSASASPIVDVKVGDGDWVNVATSAITTWSSMTNQVYLLKDAAGNPISNVSTISIRLSHLSSTTVYYDNVKILGKIHYQFTGGTSTDPTVSTNWLGGFIPESTHDVTISGGTLVLNQNATYKTITVNPTAKLTLNNTKTLTASNLLLQSDATGTATFVDNNTTPPVLSATVQQYLSATDRNWYVSSPIASATNGNLNTGASVIEYNEETGGWPTVSGTLNPMKGYVSTAGSAGTGTLSFTGNLNSGLKSIILSKKGGATYAGFNLVGNPYPSYLMWTESLATSANCMTTIWHRTKSAGTYSFQTYNASGDLGVPLSTSGYIPPMQAFWVRTTVDGSTLEVNNSMRSHGNGSTNLLKAPANKNVENQIVCLQVSNGVNSDETVIYFNPNANNGFDTYDSPKWFINNVNIPEIYTTSGTEKLVINGMKTIPENFEIPLGFGTATSNDFTLAATQLKNLESGLHIILKDNLLKKEIELTEGVAYNFNSYITVPNTGRFSLIFKTPKATTGVRETNNLNAQVFVNVNNQIIIISPEDSNYAVYNSVGQKINAGLTTSNRTIVTTHKPGIYVVKLSKNDQDNCSKVIVK